MFEDILKNPYNFRSKLVGLPFLSFLVSTNIRQVFDESFSFHIIWKDCKESESFEKSENLVLKDS